MTEALTLSDVLARGVAVQWHEAVAVVRAVAEASIGSPEDTQHLPELHQIRVQPTGRVTVIGGTVVQEPVRRLGQLLQATLGQSEPPVQLRLLISQATAPIPTYASMREIDEALGYFERPGRDAVLRDLHARAWQAAAVSAVETMPTLDTIAPLPRPHTPKTNRIKPGAKSTVGAVRLVGIGVVLVVLCGAGAQYPESRRKDARGHPQGLDNGVTWPPCVRRYRRERPLLADRAGRSWAHGFWRDFGGRTSSIGCDDTDTSGESRENVAGLFGDGECGDRAIVVAVWTGVHGGDNRRCGKPLGNRGAD